MIHYIIPPLIGALIGYCTNYIAVKMLFRPRREIRVLGHSLPFTPGAIPKNKPRLAKAVGKVVEETFFTEENIEGQFLSEESENMVEEALVRAMDQPVAELGSSILGSENRYQHVTERLTEIASEQLLRDIRSSEIIGEISGGCIDKLADQLRNSMLGMFITDGFVDTAKEMVQAEILREIDENGEEMLGRVIQDKVNQWGQDSLSEITFEAGYSDARVRSLIRRMYRGLVKSLVPVLIQRMDVSGMIEKQINAMSSEELETLVLSVMKNELNWIVNLGALIGLILGMVNLLF